MAGLYTRYNLIPANKYKLAERALINDNGTPAMFCTLTPAPP